MAQGSIIVNYYVIFRDLFPVFRNPRAFRALHDVMIEYVSSQFNPKPDAIVALDARGFLLGPLLALHFDIPFIPVRKRGKLPGDVTQVSFTLEYSMVSYSLQQRITVLSLTSNHPFLQILYVHPS
jgi:adenine phosphoribosyltransferase